MRIGEIKKIVGESLDGSHKIVLKSEAIYGGQAQKITNYAEVINALNIISKQPWNDADFKTVEKITDKYPISNTVDITTEEYNQLNSYLNTVNQKVPLYYSILESIVSEQDEKDINIKLPTHIESFAELNELNDRLGNVLKLFNIDGEFNFEGFDNGTEWYVIRAAGTLSYQYLLSALKIAREYFKTREVFFNSEEARLGYITSLKGAKNTDEKASEYKEAYLENLISEKVQQTIQEINKTNGKTEVELHTQLVMATRKLISELDEGTEFHLSLKPPEYANEKGGELRIDYSRIKALQPKEEIAQISPPRETPPEII